MKIECGVIIFLHSFVFPHFLAYSLNLIFRFFNGIVLWASFPKSIAWISIVPSYFPRAPIIFLSSYSLILLFIYVEVIKGTWRPLQNKLLGFITNCNRTSRQSGMKSFRIREVRSSNLSSGDRLSSLMCWWVLSVPSSKCQDNNTY